MPPFTLTEAWIRRCAWFESIFSDYLEHKEEDYLLKTLDKDYKTQLQEITQAKLKLTPVYSLESEKGPTTTRLSL